MLNIKFPYALAKSSVHSNIFKLAISRKYSRLILPYFQSILYDFLNRKVLNEDSISSFNENLKYWRKI